MDHHASRVTYAYLQRGIQYDAISSALSDNGGMKHLLQKYFLITDVVNFICR